VYSCGHSSSAAGASAAQLVNDQDPGSRDAETSSAAQGASGDAQLANQVMLAEYSAMRSEVDQRTSVQWNVIAPQITSTGVIASLAISRVADIVLLLVIPLLSYMLGTRYILNDYHINLISRYIRVAVGSSRTEIFFYAPSPDVSRGLMAAADVRLAGFWSGILCPGYDGGPAVGPGGRGFHWPRVPFTARWDVFLLVRRDAGWPGCGARR